MLSTRSEDYVVAPERNPDAFDPSTPNVARIIDYVLGGKDNFVADREAVEQGLALAPQIRVSAQEARRFMHRVVRFLVDSGIRQFIDIGCGLPTQGNVHEVAQTAAEDARVAYVDNDPVVIAHARALLENNPRTVVIQGDMRDPETIFRDPLLPQLIDLDQPVSILLISVLHFINDDGVVQKLIARLRDSMAPGSYLALTHVVSDLWPDTAAKLVALYQSQVAVGEPRRENLRTRAEVESFFDGLELVEPGVVYLPQWRPEPEGSAADAPLVWGVCGVGRKG
jgi:O-methyltransferase involved in polyketide biosynthesis